MGRKVRAEPMLGWVRGCLRYGCEVFFMSSPNVFVKPGPRRVTGGAYALETGFVSTLVDGAAFGNGVLGAGCVRAENDFCPSVNMTVRE